SFTCGVLPTAPRILSKNRFIDKGMGKNIKIKCCLNECKRNRQVAIISNQTIDITEDLVISKLIQRI
ncbi:MAG: hypothetical protein ACYDAP_13190, partial [Thermoplasmataceae archaeon]